MADRTSVWVDTTWLKERAYAKGGQIVWPEDFEWVPGRGCGGRGPFICAYPPAEYNTAGTRWRCPECRTRYKLTRPKPERWWRNWSAVHGHWKMTFRQGRGGS